MIRAVAVDLENGLAVLDDGEILCHLMGWHPEYGFEKRALLRHVPHQKVETDSLQ